MPRMSKADEALVTEYGFSFTPPPEKDNTRRSRYDDMWAAARVLCQKYPGNPLKVRTYNHASSAYEDAKKINNGERKAFQQDYTDWTAVAAPSTDPEEVNDDGKPLTAVYLTFIGEK